jgi:DNA-binding beta-propeller fold protein YncE
MKAWLTYALLLAAGGVDAQTTCSAKLLVSGYFSNVHVYDACTGAYERVLDSDGRISGAQATRVGPDGKLYVMSEMNGRVLRYDANTLAFEAIAVNLAANYGGTGFAFSGANEILVGGYTYDGVRRYNLAAGTLIGDAFPPRASGLNGPDNGMVFGPDGKLYIPGYDSDSVVRFDPATGQTSIFIAAHAGGLNETRGIQFEPGGQSVLITSEGSGQVLRFNAATGAFIAAIISGLDRPTGMAYHPDGSLLVGDAVAVRKYDPQTGALRGVLATAGAGEVNALTYITVLPVTASVDLTQVGSQYWVSGTGAIAGRTITVDDVISTTGAAFGADFNPANVAIKRWGSLRLAFTSCTQGMFSWDSNGASSAGFGSGSYPVQRAIENEPTERCLAQGFDNANDLQWIPGTWFGGSSRNGEGLLIDKTVDGRAFVAWFTYRPL